MTVLFFTIKKLVMHYIYNSQFPTYWRERNVSHDTLHTLRTLERWQRGEHTAAVTLVHFFGVFNSSDLRSPTPLSHISLSSAGSCVFDLIKHYGLSPLALFSSVSVCVAVTGGGDLLRFLLRWHQHKSPFLCRDTGLFLPQSISLKEFLSFTCKPFPSLTWRCMFGTQCSKHPCSGPYTWQCISARTQTFQSIHWANVYEKYIQCI